MKFHEENIYCKKCGLRGQSKCPYCRTVYDSCDIDSGIVQIAQEYFEQFMGVRMSEHGTRGLNRYDVYFWTYAKNEQEAMERVVGRLQQILQTAVNVKVATCIHEWAFLPTYCSKIGCGHAAAPDLTWSMVPPDPFPPSAATYRLHYPALTEEEAQWLVEQHVDLDKVPITMLHRAGSSEK